ncbi:MAG: ATP-binding protein [Xanthomonadales bacterium]|nr:ATP-binding protein [Xanthomonadales bacterium]
MPQRSTVEWLPFLAALSQHSPFRLAGSPPTTAGWFDRGQIEQLLINLLKNAVESGGAVEDIELAVTLHGRDVRIEVRDRGQA